jgi:hypothetical protein
MPEKDAAPTTELAKIPVYEGPEYAIMRQTSAELRELFEENMDDADEFDLEGISVPGGGGLTWSIPDLNGEPVAVEELVGVIVLKGVRRAYWEKSFDETGGGSPPDCSSLDAKRGTGYIRGDDRTKEPMERSCEKCPMAQWGSKKPEDPEDNQQACARRTLLFLIGPGDVVPQKVDLAPTSVVPFKKFMARLTKFNVKRSSAVVGLGLMNDKSRTGIKYSLVRPRLISQLPPSAAEAMKAFGKALEPMFKRTGINKPAQDLIDQEQQQRQAGEEAQRERETASDTEAERQKVAATDTAAEDNLFEKE